MIKNKPYVCYSLFVFLFLYYIKFAHAQMIGPNYYIHGTSIEIGINGRGGFEGIDQTAFPPPAGYHARSATIPFGFIANPELDGWVQYDGDFYTPGSPENGWGIEIGTDAPRNANNNFQLTGYGGLPDIPGNITHTSVEGDCINVDWEGQDTIDGTNLHIKINYFLQLPDLYYTTTVYITNNTIANIPDMYYYRSLDPDNNVELSLDYNTTNTIVSEPLYGSCDLAHVSATAVLPATQPMSYIGLAGVGDDFRVSYGGFFNRDASDIWYGTGLTSTPDSSHFGDEAISLSYRIQNLAVGATTSFRYVTILGASGAAHAINNLLHLSYIGSEGLPPSACRADTARTCGTPLTIGVSGPATTDFSWSWSPETGLSSTTDPSVTANPVTTTSYTITGTPLSACATIPVEIYITVEVAPAGGSGPVIAPVPVSCEGDPAITLTADQLGGTWFPAYEVDATGLFNSALGAGTYTVFYKTDVLCNNLDSVNVVILPAHVTILQPAVLCMGSPSITLLTDVPGGIWSGPGITDAALGTFDQNTVAGDTTYIINYSVSGVCPIHDTVTISIDSLPVARIMHIPDVCIDGASINLSAVEPGGTWYGTGITNATNGTFHASSAGLGPHRIKYVVDSRCGTATDSVIINVVSVFNTTIISPPISCINTPSINLSAYTTGGLWSGDGIVDPAAGIFDPSTAGVGLHQIDYTIYGLCGSHDTSLINVFPMPSAEFTILPTIVIASNTIVDFTNTSTGSVSWLWNFGDQASDGNTSSLQSPSHMYADSGRYCVLLEAVNAEGCSDTATYCLVVMGESIIKIPNVFTPNDDHINDVFYFETIGIKSLRCIIYNRWGIKVTEINGIGESNGWEGYDSKANAVSDGTYFYIIEAISFTEKNIKEQGFIQLIR